MPSIRDNNCIKRNAFFCCFDFILSKSCDVVGVVVVVVGVVVIDVVDAAVVIGVATLLEWNNSNDYQ